MKISLKGFITHKQSELYADCADNYAVSKEHHRFAISDGVSKSFFPKIWSDTLVNTYVSNEQDSRAAYIDSCQKKWQEQIDTIVADEKTKYFIRNAYNSKRPAMATIVGLELFEDRWTAFALGDSFLFFVPQNRTDFLEDSIRLSSKPEPIVFDNFPDYVASIGKEYKGTFIENEGTLQEGTFYLMTDALSEWFLNLKEDAITTINGWKDQPDFEQFIAQARKEEVLTNDDSALLIIKLEDDQQSMLTYAETLISSLKQLTDDELHKEKEEQPLHKEEEQQHDQHKVESELILIITNETDPVNTEHEVNNTPQEP